MISPTHTISPEWQNENALRAYPLEDDAPAATVLPPWLISDLRISCPPTYVKVYVSSAYVSDTLVSVAISGMTESGKTVGLLARTVTRDELEPHRAYSMDRLSDDASGTIAFGEVPANAQPFRLTFGARKVVKEVAPGIEEVDWIKSDGSRTCKIRFDEKPGIDDIIEFSAFTDATSAWPSIGFTWYTSESTPALYVSPYGSNYSRARCCVFTKPTGGPHVLADVNLRQMHTFKFGFGFVEIDGTAKQSIASISNLTSATSKPSLFSIKDAVGHFRWERNGVLLHDMVAVRFKNNLGNYEGAMYDRASRQLIGNQGTGAFIIGDPHIRYEVDAPIVEAAITRVRAPGVTRIVDRAHGTSATGIIDLSGNSEFRTAVDPSDPHTIVFTLTDTYREIATSVCDATPSKDACGDTPVRTINGVAPTTEETEIGGVTYPAGTILLRFR